VLLAGMTAGRVNPINPLLEPAKIAAILRQTRAKVVVTLRPFPRTDLAQKVAAALAEAPGVTHVLEVDLAGYLTGLKRLLVPLARPKNPAAHRARVLSLAAEAARHPPQLVGIDPGGRERVVALFHTGGTTGLPKVAQHRQDGILYNGWVGAELLLTEADTILCPLPLFHVFAAYPVLMAAVASGAHVVMPTPQGYRGEGVFDGFWKLVERWRASFVITVPTALAALMQRPVNADISTLRSGFSGSAALPVELYRRFEAATRVEIIEGYGLTEATCLVSCNPVDGLKKVGSVGIPFPYTEVRILQCAEDGTILRECATDEVGEICVRNPGTRPDTYSDPDKNRGLFAGGTHLRTGDLGRIDADGYLWITGRAKDLIIRGGHNIDPAMIEEAFLSHPDVAFAGAVGQPDAQAGELPAVYVELVAGATATAEALLAHAAPRIAERAAVPKHVEILPELPKTAVGKIFKPDLRRLAIRRVFDAELAGAGLAARVAEVVEDPRRGLVARVRVPPGEAGTVSARLGVYAVPWEPAA
jgi:fatty-acyl-CoA synthase